MVFRSRIGLVLAGGGARAGAHIGVLRVLEEIGFQPDILVGTSMGGLIAVMMGAGWDSHRIETFFADIDFSKLIQLDRSGAGLITPDRFTDILYDHFDETMDLRDLNIPVALVAADIQNFQRVLIDRGPAIKALKASMSIPGLMPPVRWGNHALVDGGVIENVPTQACYQLGVKRIVAVDVGHGLIHHDLIRSDEVFTHQLERMLYWLLGLANRQVALDSLMDSITYSYHLLVQYHLTLYPPSVLIQPEMPQINTFSMAEIPSAIIAGEQAARAQLALIERCKRPVRLPQFRKPKGVLPPLVTIEDIPDPES